MLSITSQTFPSNLSTRQFRLAFRTLLSITTPPSPLSVSHPNLPSTLLELLHYRALHAPSHHLPTQITHQQEPSLTKALSEQATLTITLLDTLPYLTTPTLEEWLDPAADLVQLIRDIDMRDKVTLRFWEVLASGEMDAVRAEVCAVWWTARGGRERVLSGRVLEPVMSGALGFAEERSML